MKAMLSLIILCPMLLQATNDISLIVAPDQPGRVNNHTVDVSLLPAGATVRVHVVLSDFDFTLAGAEFVLRFPAHAANGGPLRMRDSNADFSGGNAPINAHSDWGTGNLLELPVDQSGVRDASQVSHSFSVVRYGAMFRDPADRLVGNGATDITVAEFEFFLGNGTLASCISSEMEIQMYYSGSGNLSPYFSDENGDAVAVTSTNALSTVTLTNSNANFPKGDINKDGSADTADVIPMINCANQISCNLTPSEEVQIGDFNCSGSLDTADVLPLINFVNQVTGSFKTAQASQAMAREGMLAIDFQGAFGAAAQIAIDFPGEPLNLGELQFADPEAADDWQLFSSYRPEIGKVLAFVVNRNQEETEFPVLQLAYAGEKAGRIVHLQDARLFDTGRNAFALPAALNLVDSDSDAEARQPKNTPTRIDHRRGK
jgi:hypothetical protein